MEEKNLKKVIDIIINFSSAQIKRILDYKPDLTQKEQADKEIEFIKQISDIIKDSVRDLIKICRKEVADMISYFFDAGKIPHKLVIELLEIMNETFGQDIRQFSKEFMPKFLSTCSMVKNPLQRKKYGELMYSIYQNLILSIENEKEKTNQDSIKDITMTLYQVINSEWIQSSNDGQENLILYISFLGLISKFLPVEFLQKQSDNLIKEYMRLLKQDQNLETNLTEGFNSFLEKLKDENLPYFQELIKSVILNLQDLYRKPIFSNNFPFDPQQYKVRNQLLQILQNLCLFNADNCLEFFITKSSNPNTSEKISALWLSNFILMRHYGQISYGQKKQMVSCLQNLQFEKDIEIRYVVLEIIFVLCKNPQFLSDISNDNTFECEFMLYFLIKHVSMSEEEIKDPSKHVLFLNDFKVDLKQLKNRALYILQNLTNESNCGVIMWPSMLEFLTNQNFAPGITWILKALSDYIQKFKSQNNAYPEISQQQQVKIPKIYTILVRLFILLRVPFHFENLGLNIVESLQNIVETFLTVPLSEDIIQQLQTLKFSIQNKQVGDQYVQKLYTLWKEIINSFTNNNQRYNEWIMNLHEDLTATISQYQKNVDLYCHVMKMHAILLTKMENKEMVKFQLDKFFSFVHTNYSNQILNMNNPANQVTMNHRVAVAEAYGYAASTHFDLVIDKVRNIFNCEVVAKQEKGGFGSAFIGMFSKGQNNQEALQDLQATLILVYGFVCRQLDHNLLRQKIENSIINNIIGFFGKNDLTIQACVQKGIILISQSLERLREETEDKKEQEELQNLIKKYHNRFLEESFKNRKMKSEQIRLDSLESITSLIRLSPLSYEKVQNFLDESLKQFNIENPAKKDNYEFYISQLFSCVVYHDSLTKCPEKSEDQKKNNQGEELVDSKPAENNEEKEVSNEVSSFQNLNILIKKLYEQFGKNTDQIQYYFKCLVNALSNFKKNVQETDINYILDSVSIVLKFNYIKNDQLNEQARFCLEKILLNLKIFPDVTNKIIEQFNQDIITQLSQQQGKKDIEDFIVKCADLVKEEADSNIIFGYLTLSRAYCTKYMELFKKPQLQSMLNHFEIYFDSISKIESQKNQERMQSQVNEVLQKLFESNLVDCLDLIGSQVPVFPLREYYGKILISLCQSKQLLFKIFNYLTDILNNPENKIKNDRGFSNDKTLGNLMTNAVIYIGFMIENCPDLHVLINNYFFQIFGTFLLRFSTSFCNAYQPEEEEGNEGISSKVTLWSFEIFLKYSNKSDLGSEISQGLKKKLITQDMLKDGISEIVMILCKVVTIKEIEQLMKFLKDFIPKKNVNQRSICFIVISQLIQSSNQTKDFDRTSGEILKDYYYYLIQTCLKYVEDNSDDIRNMIYRGIGNITYLIQYGIAVNEGKLQEILEKIEKEEKKKQEQLLELTDDKQQSVSSNIIDLENANLEENIDQDEEIRVPKFELTGDLYTHIIETLFTGLDDSNELCIRDSLNGLQNIVDFLDQDFLADFSINLLSKVSLNFEKQNPKLRMVAFNLFGKLFTSMQGTSKIEEFEESNLHYSLVSLIIHLLDESLSVRSVCETTLKSVLKIGTLDKLREVFEATKANSKQQQQQNKNSLFDQQELLLVNILQCIFNEYEGLFSLYADSLIEFSKAPDYNTKGGAILGLLYWKSVINQITDKEKQAEYYDLAHRIDVRMDEILSERQPRKIDQYILKGSYYLVQVKQEEGEQKEEQKEEQQQ